MKKSMMAILLLSVSMSSYASDNGAVLGGAIGAAVGAAIGHEMNGKSGAILGGAIGAAAGAAVGSSRHHDRALPPRTERTHDVSRHEHGRRSHEWRMQHHAYKHVRHHRQKPHHPHHRHAS